MKQDIRIYLVDDDKEDRFLMTEAFKKIGAQEKLFQFVSGESLLAHLQTSSLHLFPQLIILDYNMPQMNGIEVLHELKKCKILSGIKVVMFSTSVNDHIKKKCLELGAIDCINKPTSFNSQVELAQQLFTLSTNTITSS